MWDVSGKNNTARTATAQAILRAKRETLIAIKEGKVPKGDPLPVAKIAAVQAAKNTPAIIPYCHPLPLTHVGVEFMLHEDSIEVFVTTKFPPDRAGHELDTLRRSLELLQTDRVDLWLIHWPGHGSVNQDIWRAFVEARASGLTREIGVSNFGLPPHFRKFVLVLCLSERVCPFCPADCPVVRDDLGKLQDAGAGALALDVRFECRGLRVE